MIKIYKISLIAIALSTCLAIYFFTVAGDTNRSEVTAAAIKSIVVAATTNNINLKDASATVEEIMIYYNPNVGDIGNEKLLKSLQDIIYTSDDRELAIQALLAYSRARQNSDVIDMLKYGLNKGYIDQKVYASEVTHSLPTLDNKRFLEGFDDVKKINDLYAYEIMINSITGNPAPWVERDNWVNGGVKNFIEQKHPGFPKDISELGFIDIIRSENWYDSLSALSGTKEEGLAYINDYVINKINDPRDVLALISGGFYGQLQEGGFNAASAKIEKLARLYKESYPANAAANAVIAKLP